jgi:folate-binding protein YgfZ
MPDDPSTPNGATWHAPVADLQRALSTPVGAELDELGVIEAIGPDAAAFLHAQLTGDMLHLDSVQVQPCGVCTPKGRLLATFDVWRDGDTVHLQLPREILPSVLKRLAMFVLRAKVKLADASEGWTTVALLGPGTDEWIRATLGCEPPAHGTLVVDGARLSRAAPAPAIAHRYVLRVAPPAAQRWQQRLAAIERVSPAVWWWSQIDAGVPTVFAATQDRFVPQMINFEVLGGVNFRKGCYPGQEVVARSQYLGKLRRRMGIAHVDGPVAAGADVYATGEAQPVGTVVMAAGAPAGGIDLLFECPVQKLDAERLTAGVPDGPALQLRPLPYQLVDVTA